jgi:hypothetical protein
MPWHEGTAAATSLVDGIARHPAPVVSETRAGGHIVGVPRFGPPYRHLKLYESVSTVAMGPEGDQARARDRNQILTDSRRVGPVSLFSGGDGA